MINIIARWENTWFDYEYGKNADLQIWQLVCDSFKVDRMIFIPKIVGGEEYDSIEEALAMVSGIKVFLEMPQRAIEIDREPIYLRDFVHPENAVYIFGNTSTDNSRWVEEKDILLSIDTPKHLGMFGFSVLGIVLYDRRLKSGS